LIKGSVVDLKMGRTIRDESIGLLCEIEYLLNVGEQRGELFLSQDSLLSQWFKIDLYRDRIISKSSHRVSLISIPPILFAMS